MVSLGKNNAVGAENLVEIDLATLVFNGYQKGSRFILFFERLSP